MPGPFSFIPAMPQASHATDGRGYYDYGQLGLAPATMNALNGGNTNGHHHRLLASNGAGLGVGGAGISDATAFSIPNALHRDQIMQRNNIQPFVGVLP